jgi:hypothetical protein
MDKFVSIVSESGGLKKYFKMMEDNPIFNELLQEDMKEITATLNRIIDTVSSGKQVEVADAILFKILQARLQKIDELRDMHNFVSSVNSNKILSRSRS